MNDEKVPIESMRPPHLIEKLKEEDHLSTKKRINWKEIGKELFWAVVVIFGIVLPFRMYVAEPFLVDGRSMDPTFKTSDYLLVDKFSENAKNPKRNTVLVFKYPGNPSKNFIKRVIGLPGETVIVKNNTVQIINAENPKGFFLEQEYILHKSDISVEKTLGNTEYFVMGDNRAESFDSRFWGPLDEKYIEGVPILQLYPFNKISYMPGKI